MNNHDQQSRWATFTGRRVGALQLSRADRLCRSRSSAQKNRSDTSPELKTRELRSQGNG